jgi:hypothetical protein
MTGGRIRRGRGIKTRIGAERFRGVGVWRMRARVRGMDRIRRGVRGDAIVLLLQSPTMILVLEKKPTIHHLTNLAVVATANANRIQAKVGNRAKNKNKDKAEANTTR